MKAMKDQQQIKVAYQRNERRQWRRRRNESCMTAMAGSAIDKPLLAAPIMTKKKMKIAGENDRRENESEERNGSESQWLNGGEVTNRRENIVILSKICRWPAARHRGGENEK
jgi:hypothetical protein